MAQKQLTEAQQLKVVEAYHRLTPSEKAVVSLVESNDYIRITKQIKFVETYNTKLKSEKSTSFIKECITTLKEGVVDKKSIKDLAYKVVELKEAAKSLLEDEVGGEVTMNLGSMKTLRNIKLSVLENPQNPETIFIDFEVPVYPVGATFMRSKESVADLDKRFARLGRGILANTIRAKGRIGEVFTGDGIWDGSVSLGYAAPGKVATGRGELALHINTASGLSIQDIKSYVVELLKDIDSFIPTQIEEVSPELQKASLKNRDAEKADRLSAIRSKASKGGDDDEEGDSYGGSF